MDNNINFIPKNELVASLYKEYNFGYYDDKSDSIPEKFEKSFFKYVLNRIDKLYHLSNFFIIEENYVEKEWKKLISEHYINSAYALRLKEHVIRVHCLLGSKFSDENYLGFFTLRPIEELSIALSFVYLNWNHSFFGNNSWVMTYSKQVNYKGQTVSMKTYPLLSQDSIVTCCADVNVYMLSKYLHNKYGVINVDIDDVLKANFTTERKLPRKISVQNIKSILDNIKIPFFHYKFNSIDSLGSVINAYIESALPVILIVNEHAIQIIGYLKQDENKYSYIVYDDSGYLADKLTDNEKDCMIYLTNERSIRKLMDESTKESIIKHSEIYNSEVQNNINAIILLVEKMQNRLNVIVPVFNRVYIDAIRYFSKVSEFISRTFDMDSKSNDALRDKDKIILKIKNGEEIDLLETSRIRSFLVDNSKVKSHFKENVIPYLMNNDELNEKYDFSNIETFISSPLSHYLWYSEIEIQEDVTICLCADPTMYYATEDDELFFMNLFNVPIDKNKRLELLTKGKCLDQE